MKHIKQQQLFPDDHEELFFEDGKICIKCEHKLPLTSFSPASGGNFLRPECKKSNNKLSKARVELKQKHVECVKQKNQYLIFTYVKILKYHHIEVNVDLAN